jgi:hypothetical protein
LVQHGARLDLPFRQFGAAKTLKPIKMLKMKIDPTMCMKTKGAHDKMIGVLQDFVDIVCAMTHFFRFRGEKRPKTRLTHECVGNTVLGIGDF